MQICGLLDYLPKIYPKNKKFEINFLFFIKIRFFEIFKFLLGKKAPLVGFLDNFLLLRNGFKTLLV